MCGIAGTAGFVEPGLAQRMIDALRHRGPDSGAIAEFPDANMSLGIRRLAILDLETGDQPMVSADGRVHLVMNGEIYNFRELREAFVREGYPFRSHSDTEVVLASYLKWGVDAWSHLDGMFAIALVDRRAEPRMVLARDRVGIKPLYIAHHQGRTAFASEIKAIRQSSGSDSSVSLGAIRDYLALRYVPGPGTMFTGIKKFPAGHSAIVTGGDVTFHRWWIPPVPNRRPVDHRDATERFGSTLRHAVHSHMVADVPVGAFLSGGIDSSVIVALMREASSSPLHTFSIGFPDFPGEDTQGASQTAHHLGTIHHEIECRASDMAALPELAWALDEPVGDAIVVPMAVLSREARRQVKVVLSGEGADEILGGYLFHRRLVELARLRKVVPGPAWRLAASAVRHLPTSVLRAGFDYPGELGSQGRDKVSRLLESAARDPITTLYQNSISLFDAHDLKAIAAPPLAHQLPSAEPIVNGNGHLTTLQTLIDAQFRHWLPDDILMKADKMSMTHSLELRVPFMDEAVIEAAIDLPDSSRLTWNTNKRALRDFAAPLLPPAIMKAPKRAFYVPLESYVTSSPLKEVFAHMLDRERLRRRGLFNPDAVAALGATAKTAGFLALKRLFAIVMLELWFERFAPDACWS